MIIHTSLWGALRAYECPHGKKSNTYAGILDQCEFCNDHSEVLQERVRQAKIEAAVDQAWEKFK